MRIARHEVKSSPEDQVTHDIVVQIRGPLRHVERLRPVFAVIVTLKNDVLESLHILDQIHLRRSQGFLRECMLHHTSMSCVDVAIGLGMNAICASC
jgi:hypothetical protein